MEPSTELGEALLSLLQIKFTLQSQLCGFSLGKNSARLRAMWGNWLLVSIAMFSDDMVPGKTYDSVSRVRSRAASKSEKFFSRQLGTLRGSADGTMYRKSPLSKTSLEAIQ
ncbi:hypothetical protein ABKN59_006466 [Abortiporus biennis]